MPAQRSRRSRRRDGLTFSSRPMADSGPGLRRLLRRPAYRKLWLARTISQIGDVAQFTTLALMVIALTGSALGVSAVVLAEIVPVLLLAPLAGSLVDRLPRVRVMVGADAVKSRWRQRWRSGTTVRPSRTSSPSACRPARCSSPLPRSRCCPPWLTTTSSLPRTVESGRLG